MAAADAVPVPRKNVAFRTYFALRYVDGKLDANWVNPSGFLSLDGAAWTNSTNAPVEILSPKRGAGYLDLTATEMNCDGLVVLLQNTHPSSMPLMLTFYPEEAGDYRVDTVKMNGEDFVLDPSGIFDANVVQVSGTWISIAGSVDANVVQVNGEAVNLVTASGLADQVWDEAIGQHQVIGSTGYALNTASGNLIGGGAGGITAADVWSYATRQLTSAQSFNLTGNITGNLTGSVGSVGLLNSGAIADLVWDEPKLGHNVAGTMGDALNQTSGTLMNTTYGLSAIETYVDCLPSTLNNLSQTDIRTAVGLTSANLNTQLVAISGYVDGIEAKTNNLPSDPADQSAVEAAITAAFTEIKGAGWTSTDTLEGIWTDTNELVTDVNSIVAKLPSKSYLTGSNNSDGDIQLNEATGSFTTDAITSTSLATSAIDEIVDQVWNEILSGHVINGSAGHALAMASGNLSGIVVQADVTRIDGISVSATNGILDVNTVQVSGNYVSIEDFRATGFSTHSAADVYTAFSDGSNLTAVGLSSTALANVNTEVDTALNTAIPGSPTTNSINERIVTMDGRILGTIAAGTHKPQTGDSYALIGAGGASLNAIPWNSAWDSEVQSEVTDALVASGIARTIDLQPAAAAALTAYDAATGTDVSTAQSTIVTDLDDIKGTGFVKDTHSLTNIEAYVDNLPSDPADASVIAAAFASLEAHGDSTWSTATGFSTNSDILALSGSIANLVWDEPKSAHTIANTFGDYLDDEITSRAALGEPLTQSEIRTAIGLTSANLNTQLVAISGLVNDVATGSDIADLQSALETQIEDLPTVAEFEARTLPSANYFDYTTDIVDTNIVQVSGQYVSIRDFADSVSVSGGATAAEVWGYATRQLTGTQTFNLTGNITGNLSGSVGSVGLLNSGAIADLVWDELKTGHNIAGTMGDALNQVSGMLMNATYGLSAIENYVDCLPSTLNNLSQTDIRTAVGLTSANLNTQLLAISGYAGSVDGKILGTLDTGTHKPQSGDSFTRIGSGGASLNAIPWNAAWDAQVQSEVTDALVASGIARTIDLQPAAAAALTAYDAATGTDVSTAQSTIVTDLDDIKGTGFVKNTHSLYQIEAYVDGIEAKTNNLPSDPADQSAVEAAITAAFTEIKGAGWSTTDTLENIWNDTNELVTDVNNILVDTDTMEADIKSYGDIHWSTPTGFATSADLNTVSGVIVSRTIPSADYFNPAVDTVANVTTTANLTNFPSGAIADAVWDEQIAGHATTGTTGKAVSDVLVDTSTTLNNYVDEIESLLKNGTYGLQAIENIVDTMEADIKSYGDSNWATATGFATPAMIPSSGDIAGAVWDASINDHQDIGSTGFALNIASGSYFSTNYTNATLVTVLSYLDAFDLNGVAIKPNGLTATGLDTTAVDAIVDQVWNEVLSGHQTIGSAGYALNVASGNLIGGSSVGSVSGVVEANVIYISGVPVGIDSGSVADSAELSILGNLLLNRARIIRLLP